MLEFISNYTKGLQHLVGMAQAETATATRPAGLFSQLTFAIICRDAIDDAAAAKVRCPQKMTQDIPTFSQRLQVRPG